MYQIQLGKNLFGWNSRLVGNDEHASTCNMERLQRFSNTVEQDGLAPTVIVISCAVREFDLNQLSLGKCGLDASCDHTDGRPNRRTQIRRRHLSANGTERRRKRTANAGAGINKRSVKVEYKRSIRFDCSHMHRFWRTLISD